MKSVLISIQPYWVFLIIARKMGWDIPQNKSVEIRKTYPKEKSWNKKAIIYCTQDKKSFNRIPKEYQGSMRPLLGKVIGEFVCDYIAEISKRGHVFVATIETPSLGCRISTQIEFPCRACMGMSYDELSKYSNNKIIYEWNISNLKIYDKPKELYEFERPCPYDEECWKCKYHYDGSFYEPPCCNWEDFEISRPPQSWCYVDETN